MARKRKKNKSVVYPEITGLVVVGLSVITLLRNGVIGDKLYTLCTWILGWGGMVLPVMAIVVALDRLVIRKRWLVFRGSRLFLGFFCVLLSITMVMHRYWMDGFAVQRAADIMAITWSQRSHAGGSGLIGAFLLMCVYWLLGPAGVIVSVVVLILIGLLLIVERAVWVALATSCIARIGALRERWSQYRQRQSSRDTKPSILVVHNDRSVDDPAPADDGDAGATATQSPAVTVYVASDVVASREHPDSMVREEETAESVASEFGTQSSLSVTVPYQLPTVELLARASQSKVNATMDQARDNARKLEVTLDSFGVKVRVLQVVQGPAVTRYELQPDIGVKVSRIVNLTDDIALALAAKGIRMEAPIPGKSAIGIEVPNQEVSVVTLREVIESSSFQESSSKLSIALGRDIAGQPVVAHLSKMPHVLVAGATGSGKSVCINGMIASILFKATPEEVRFLMIDPKMVELNVYNGIPHLLAPVVTDPKRAAMALKKVVVEMEKRYGLFSQTNTRNIEGYNVHQQRLGEPLLPWIVVIVDELADLMMVAAGDVEEAICRLAQMARAAGIHLILATQRPSVDVITGVIKANIPTRIAFGVSSQVDSRTILDMAGAEKLLGRGDMLYCPVGAAKAQRIQGAFLSDHEVEAIVQFCRVQGEVRYVPELTADASSSASEEQSHPSQDELFDPAARIIIESKQASVSMLQRRLRVGFSRGARLLDELEAYGVVGRFEGTKPREVIMTLEEYEQSINKKGK